MENDIQRSIKTRHSRPELWEAHALFITIYSWHHSMKSISNGKTVEQSKRSEPLLGECKAE